MYFQQMLKAEILQLTTIYLTLLEFMYGIAYLVRVEVQLKICKICENYQI